jgi:hypothetical protein
VAHYKRHLGGVPRCSIIENANATDEQVPLLLRRQDFNELLLNSSKRGDLPEEPERIPDRWGVLLPHDVKQRLPDALCLRHVKFKSATVAPRSSIPPSASVGICASSWALCSLAISSPVCSDGNATTVSTTLRRCPRKLWTTKPAENLLSSAKSLIRPTSQLQALSDAEAESEIISGISISGGVLVSRKLVFEVVIMFLVQADFETIIEIHEIPIYLIRMHYGHGHPRDKCFQLNDLVTPSALIELKDSHICVVMPGFMTSK